jgi:hypothetical protein
MLARVGATPAPLSAKALPAAIRSSSPIQPLACRSIGEISIDPESFLVDRDRQYAYEFHITKISAVEANLHSQKTSVRAIATITGR